MAFQALTQTMTALTDVHITLLELAEQKKQVLIHNDVEQLMRIIARENKLMKQVEELILQRNEATGQFMIEKGYKPNPKVKISDLTRIIFNIEDKKLLIHLQKQLMENIRKLQEANQINRQLVEQSLQYINYSLDLISSPPEDDLVYQHPKQRAYGTRRPGLFDTRS